jgi:tetratricopeptide (TPR) repeat protein
VRIMLKKILPFGMDARTRGRKLRDEGDEAMRQRDWPKAVQLYRSYLIHHTDDAPILVQFGHALKELGQIEAALAAYSKAVAAAPADGDAQLHLTNLLRSLDKDKAALPAVDEVSPILRADRERDLKKWSVAARYYSEHLEDHPRDAGIWVQLGHMLKEASLFDEAIYAYQVAKRLETEPSDVAIHLAELLTRMGRAAEAKPLWADLFQQKESFFFHNV